MTIGSWLDNRINNLLVAAGRIGHRALSFTWPLDHVELAAMKFLAMPVGGDFDEARAEAYLAGQERLAEAEAERDSWEPDELYAAQLGLHKDADTPVGNGDSAGPVQEAAQPGPAHSPDFELERHVDSAREVLAILRAFYPRDAKAEYHNYVAAAIVASVEYGGEPVLEKLVTGLITKSLNSSQ